MLQIFFFQKKTFYNPSNISKIYGFINHVRHRSFNDYISSSLSDVRGEQENLGARQTSAVIAVRNNHR